MVGIYIYIYIVFVYYIYYFIVTGIYTNHWDINGTQWNSYGICVYCELFS